MPFVLPEFAPLQTSARTRLLICATSGPSPTSELIIAHGYALEVVTIDRPISARLRALLSAADLLLLDLTASKHEVLNTIQELTAVIGIGSLRPRLLCFSCVPRNPQFVLRVQNCGARYIRIGGPEMLLEAIDLLITEVDDLERKGPRFQIIHQFSRGICTPGEEISAVLLTNGASFFQLRLGLAERFVFDFLAQRRISVDSLQIVSGLAGDRFYREQAVNSGQRQVKKIRRPTVKVLMQRIRDAMASTFVEARVDFDPYDVLRSCPAEGTNRVLYRLRAQIQWRHISQ
jgi:hypothetical protein